MIQLVGIPVHRLLMHLLPSPACWRILYPFSSSALNSKCFLDPSRVPLLCSAASFSWPVSFPPEHTPRFWACAPTMVPFYTVAVSIAVCSCCAGDDPSEAFLLLSFWPPHDGTFLEEGYHIYASAVSVLFTPCKVAAWFSATRVSLLWQQQGRVSCENSPLPLPQLRVLLRPRAGPSRISGGSCDDPVEPLARVSPLPPITGLRLRKHLSEPLFLAPPVFLETSSKSFIVSTSLLVSQPAACVKLWAESWHLSVSPYFTFHCSRGWLPPVIALGLTMTLFSEWPPSLEWVSLGGHPAQLAGGFIYLQIP